MRHRTWRGIPRSLHPLRGAGGRVLRVEQLDAAHPQRAGLLLGAMRPVEAVTTEASSSRCRYSREMRPETRGRLLFLCLPRPGPLALPRQDDSAVWEVRGSRLRAGAAGVQGHRLVNMHPPLPSPQPHSGFLLRLKSHGRPRDRPFCTDGPGRGHDA